MIKNIQYLRFFAALMVILAHANLAIYGVSSSVTDLGGWGVDIFFIISGFIMPYILFGGICSSGSTARLSAFVFIKKRLVRIWPLYFLVTTVVVIISYLVSSEWISHPTVDFNYIFNGGRVEFRWFIQTLTFTHGDKPPILGIGWTLQVEFIFYVMMGVVLILGGQRFVSLECGVLLILVLVTIANVVFQAESQLIKSAMMFEFIFGVYLYRLMSEKVLLPKWMSLAILVVCIPLFIFFNISERFAGAGGIHFRPVSWGLPAFFVVWAALSLEGITKQVRWLSLLGDASYSLYLTHGVASPIFVFFWVTHDLVNKINIVFYFVAYIIFCHTVGLLTYFKVEKPIIGFLKLPKKSKLQSDFVG